MSAARGRTASTGFSLPILSTSPNDAIIQLVADTRTARYWAVSPKIDRRQSISAVDGRLREKSTVDGQLREIDRRRSIEGEKGKNKKKRKKKKKRVVPISPRHPRRRTVVARGSPAPTRRRRRFFSRARRRNVSLRGEKGRGDRLQDCSNSSASVVTPSQRDSTGEVNR
ncbi:hypothetical protein BHM03_00014063 [Ensete ventricosum]|nr:hypothetical protein BHM03_00014063 [Ensete ventricosum]